MTFRKQDRQLRQRSRARKQQRVTDLIQEAQLEAAKGLGNLHRLTKSIAPKSAKRTIHLRDHEGRLLDAAGEIQSLRTYFEDLYQSCSHHPPDHWLTAGITVSESEVAAALGSMSSTKALPPGHVPIRLWKEAAPEIVPRTGCWNRSGGSPGQSAARERRPGPRRRRHDRAGVKCVDVRGHSFQGRQPPGTCRLGRQRRWSLFGSSFHGQDPLGQGCVSSAVGLSAAVVSACPCIIVQLGPLFSRQALFGLSEALPLPFLCRSPDLIVIHCSCESHQVGGLSSSPADTEHGVGAWIPLGPPLWPPVATTTKDPSAMPVLSACSRKQHTTATVGGFCSFDAMEGLACHHPRMAFSNSVPNNDIGGSGVMTCLLDLLAAYCQASCRTWAFFLFCALSGLLRTRASSRRETLKPSRGAQPRSSAKFAGLRPLGECARVTAPHLNGDHPWDTLAEGKAYGDSVFRLSFGSGCCFCLGRRSLRGLHLRALTPCWLWQRLLLIAQRFQNTFRLPGLRLLQVELCSVSKFSRRITTQPIPRSRSPRQRAPLALFEQPKQLLRPVSTETSLLLFRASHSSLTALRRLSPSPTAWLPPGMWS